MRKLALSLLAVMASFGVLAGCSQEFLPINDKPVGIRIPTQQMLIAGAANKAIDQLNFKPFNGRVGYVETVGVFPHSDRDLMDFLKVTLEAKLAEASVVVVQAKTSYKSVSAAGDQATVIEEVQVPEGADYRFVLSAEAAGGDLRYETSLVTYIFYTGRVVLKVYAIPIKKGLPSKVYETSGEEEKELGSVCCMVLPLSSSYTPQKQVLPPNLVSGCIGSVSGMCGSPQ